jgi:hypothetical protein
MTFVGGVPIIPLFLLLGTPQFGLPDEPNCRMLRYLRVHEVELR